MQHSTFNPEPTLNGVRDGMRLIGYSVAIRKLDSGHYDKCISDGLNVVACIFEAEENGWLSLNIDKQIIVWRWLIVAVFIAEEQEKNGTVDVPNDDGGIDTATVYSGKHGSISVYPGPARFAMANHVEGCAIEKYGTDTGKSLALRMYQDMVATDGEHGFRLSAIGREGFSLLFDSFIDQIKTEGMPDMPVMH